MIMRSLIDSLKMVGGFVFWVFWAVNGWFEFKENSVFFLKFYFIKHKYPPNLWIRVALVLYIYIYICCCTHLSWSVFCFFYFWGSWFFDPLVQSLNLKKFSLFKSEYRIEVFLGLYPLYWLGLYQVLIWSFVRSEERRVGKECRP